MNRRPADRGGLPWRPSSRRPRGGWCGPWGRGVLALRPGSAVSRLPACCPSVPAESPFDMVSPSAPLGLLPVSRRVTCQAEARGPGSEQVGEGQCPEGGRCSAQRCPHVCSAAQGWGLGGLAAGPGKL